MTNVIEPSKRTVVKAKNVSITLYVKTDQIQNRPVDACCYIGKKKEKCKDYTKKAYIGKIVTWKGVSSNPEEYEVNIISIHHDKGDNIFSQNRLPGSGRKKGKVSGLVLNLTSDGMDYEYIISFEVKHKGTKQSDIFHIDPKIQVDK